MTNTFKYNGVCTLLALVSLNSFADDNWVNREVHMQCGPAVVNITAECKVDPEDTDSNICKKLEMKVSQKSKTFSTKLPYMPIDQKEKLEKQNFTFSEIINSADWAPQKMLCIDGKYILIGYWDGMNDAEKIDNSLSANASAPIFDLSGNFIKKEAEKKIRSKIPPSPQGTTYINFVYGND